jgi:hypothetical protein
MRTILIGVFLLGGSCLQANILNLNTGQLGTVGSYSDPHWTIVSAPGGSGLNSSGAAYLEQNTYNSGKLWSATAAGANYISAGDCGQQVYTASCGAGVYLFSTTFTSVGTGSLNFQVAGDNEVKVFLNGTLLIDYGNQTDATAWTNLSSLVTSSTLNGVNTLYLEVINAGDYTGGLLTGTVSGQAESFSPEPATYALTAGALMGLAGLKRYRAARR